MGRQSSKLEIVNLCPIAPASKRSKRTVPIDAVVLHQMSLSRGNDLQRYKRVTAHFVIAPNGGAQLHPLSARLSASDGFNGRSVSIEFAGNLRSVRAGPRSGRPVDDLDPAQGSGDRGDAF